MLLGRGYIQSQSFSDIIGDIVTPKALKKIKNLLEQMRRSPSGRKADDFVSIAKQLGRVRDHRGKEPTYVRENNPALSPPLSIPGHPGDIKPGTARNIIDALLDDVDEWAIHLQEVEDDDDNHDN